MPMIRLALLVALLCVPLAARGQVIPVRTIPVAQGSQFHVLPAENPGMGRVPIALDDRIGDPFVNPARGRFLPGTYVSVHPAFYTYPSFYRGSFMQASTERASGRTIPVSAGLQQGNLWGGLLLSRQDLTTVSYASLFPTRPSSGGAIPDGGGGLASRPANFYLGGYAGGRLPGTRFSLGAGFFASRMSEIDGARLFPRRGETVSSNGKMNEVRAGLHAEWDDGHALDLVILHHHRTMAYDLHRWVGVGADRVFLRELDEMRAWAVQTGYRRTLSHRLDAGVELIFNRQWLPNVPRDALMGLTDDPGSTLAFNLGIGAAYRPGNAILTADLVYEPVWSRMTGDAAEEMTNADGIRTVRSGREVLDNFYRFDNVHVRGSVQIEGDPLGLLFGIDAYHVHYVHDHTDFVTGRDRDRRSPGGRRNDRSWVEWLVHAGLRYRISGFDLRYDGSIAFGTGEVFRFGDLLRTGNTFVTGDFALVDEIVGVHEGLVITHRLSIVVASLGW